MPRDDAKKPFTTRADLEADIIATAVDSIGCEPEKVTLDATAQSLGADSLDTIEMIQAIEDTYGISIEDEDLPAKEQGITLRALADLVEKKVKE